MTNTMNKIRKGIANLIIAGTLFLPSLGKAENPVSGSVEAFASEKYLATDTKLSGQIGKMNNFFARNKTSFDYKTGEPSQFSLIDINQNTPIKGLDLTVETTFQENGNKIEVTPGVGFTYFKEVYNQKGNTLSLLVEPIVNLQKSENICLLGTINYGKQLNKDLKAFVEVETLTGFNTLSNEVYDFLNVKPRIGVEYKGKLGFGVGANISLAPNTQPIFSPGIFGRVKF